MANLRLQTAYWIAFGPHGPRAQTPPGEGWKIVNYTLVGVAASAVLFFGTRYFARPPPRTLSKEWQEASEEYLRVRSINFHQAHEQIADTALETRIRTDYRPPWYVGPEQVDRPGSRATRRRRRVRKSIGEVTGGCSILDRLRRHL